MLECVSFKLSTPTHSHSNGNSTEEEEEDNPSVTSPNVSREFYRAVQSHYFNEIRSVIEAPPQVHHLDDEDSHHRHVLSQLLKPDSHSFRKALSKGNLKASFRASFQPASASAAWSTATATSTPRFPTFSPSSPPMRRRSRSRGATALTTSSSSSTATRIPSRSPAPTGSATASPSSSATSAGATRESACPAVAGTIVVAAVVAAHAAVGFSAFLASPLAMLKQLEAVENGTLVVNDVDTIDSLVDRVQTSVEADKAYVRFALERGRERHPVQEVLKQLRKNQAVLQQLLGDLEQHIYLCFCSVNMARHALLQEIGLHQTPY